MHRHSTRWRRAAAGMSLGAALVVTGCSSPMSAPTPGSLAAGGIDLHGQSYTVGGRDFPEQVVLCKMQIAAMQSVGATVGDRCDIPGPTTARTALVNGQIDMYWSYTGTGWVVDLGKRTPTIHDPRRQYEAVRDADAANGIVWTDPAPFDDTFAVATTRAFATARGLRTTSDLARLVRAHDPAATLCVDADFASRADGLPGWREAYGIAGFLTGPPQLTTIDRGAIYDAVAHGNPCTFGEVFSTDGRVPADDLQPLVDDRNFFPNYNGSNTIRKEAVDRNPQIVRLSNALAARLDDATILGLNSLVSSQGQDAGKVARDWLRQQGFIGP